MNDSAKILLKQQLEEQSLRQKQYETLDLQDYPGWTLLLKDVVKAYGVCPFLNVWDDECNKRRGAWVVEQPDSGAAYHTALAQITDARLVTDLENEMEQHRCALETHVRKLLGSIALPHDTTFEELITNVYKRRDAKSQNKKSKERWVDTLRCLDVLALQAHIDFAKYVSVATGYHFRYKMPEAAVETDETFTREYEAYVASQGRLHSLRLLRDREVAYAKKQLSSLILDNFQIEQVGRYYRRWSSLSDDKKVERIASYCYWYMRQNDHSVVAAENMIAFIRAKLESKDLKVTNPGLEWNGKQGIITNIAVAYDSATSEFTLTNEIARSSLKKKRPTKKKNDDVFKSEEGKIVQDRANRLLLYEIVRTGSTHRDTVVDAVVRNLRCRWLPSAPVRGYLAARYDEMMTVITKHPIVSGRAAN